jgi:hypothetical protein
MPIPNSHPNLTFTYWLNAIERKLDRELDDGDDYSAITKMYEQGVPWQTIVTMLQGRRK